jgi:serine/threonine protein phosphatase PrpC
MQFSVFQDSLIGGRRSNQDRMGYRFNNDCVLLALADGMGGHLRGEAAATIAVQALAKAFDLQARPYIRKPEVFLREVLLEAHRDIHRYRAMHNLPDSPRTTVVACLIQHGQALWAHCGDSRLYWLRDGAVLARTRDHSHIEQLIAAGQAQESERDTHPERNKLYNCLGAPQLPEVEISAPVTLAAGDQLLLCSDGLWGVLPDSALVAGLRGAPLDSTVPDLLRMATRTAGDTADNATALALEWQGDDTPFEDDCATTVIAGDMPTLILDGFGPAKAQAASFADEFAAAFGMPLSATIAGGAATPQAGRAAAGQAADELDRQVADLRAAIASTPPNKK